MVTFFVKQKSLAFQPPSSLLKWKHSSAWAADVSLIHEVLDTILKSKTCI